MYMVAVRMLIQFDLYRLLEEEAGVVKLQSKLNFSAIEN